MSNRNGQSLLEILIAIAIGVIMIGVAIAVIAPALKIRSETNEAKIGAALGRELIENFRVFAESNWHNIDGLATGTASNFYFTTTTSFLAATSGQELVTISTTTYTRFFYIEDVCRTSTDYVTGTAPCSGADKLDPSTKRVTVVFRWPESATNTFSTYVTRFNNRVYSQSDWSSGPDFWGPTTSTPSGFATSSNLNFSSTTGSIKILNIE